MTSSVGPVPTGSRSVKARLAVSPSVRGLEDRSCEGSSQGLISNGRAALPRRALLTCLLKPPFDIDNDVDTPSTIEDLYVASIGVAGIVKLYDREIRKDFCWHHIDVRGERRCSEIRGVEGYVCTFDSVRRR